MVDRLTQLVDAGNGVPAEGLVDRFVAGLEVVLNRPKSKRLRQNWCPSTRLADAAPRDHLDSGSADQL